MENLVNRLRRIRILKAREARAWAGIRQWVDAQTSEKEKRMRKKEENENEVTVAYETLEHELTVAYDTVENELEDAVLKFLRLKATIARSCQMLKTMKEKKQELKIQYVLYEKRRKEEARKKLNLKAAVIKQEEKRKH
ncbi:hypothetical protein ACF0H5_013181 [Mactra antiquata]